MRGIRGAGLLVDRPTSRSPVTRPSNSKERATGENHTLSDAGRAQGTRSDSKLDNHGGADSLRDSASGDRRTICATRRRWNWPSALPPKPRALGSASLNWDRQRKLPLESEDTQFLKRASESDADRPGLTSGNPITVGFPLLNLPPKLDKFKSKTDSKFECWFDGACEPINPGGTASYGILIRGDSQLVIKQLSGKWKAKNGLYLAYYSRAKESLRLLKESCEVFLEWIPREENERCDALSKANVNAS